MEQNVKRLTELKAEAAEMTRINNLSAQQLAAAAAASSHPEARELTLPAASSSNPNAKPGNDDRPNAPTFAPVAAAEAGAGADADDLSKRRPQTGKMSLAANGALSASAASIARQQQRVASSSAATGSGSSEGKVDASQDRKAEVAGVEGAPSGSAPPRARASGGAAGDQEVAWAREHNEPGVWPPQLSGALPHALGTLMSTPTCTVLLCWRRLCRQNNLSHAALRSDSAVLLWLKSLQQWCCIRQVLTGAPACRYAVAFSSKLPERHAGAGGAVWRERGCCSGTRQALRRACTTSARTVRAPSASAPSRTARCAAALSCSSPLLE